jgi:cell division protein FtsZ
MTTQNLNSRFSFDEQSQDNAKIKVIGVGGGGGNAINNMIMKGLHNVEYIALNTDNQALKQNEADITIQVGQALTNGLGAGARPEIGREAVEENRHEIEESIEGADMIFVTAGMGGGTGTGGAPIVANIAKRKGILTVGVVTTPFICEGKVRSRYATEGIAELKKNCDTVIVIPNERLLDISTEETSLKEAFDMANEVLYNATRGISDLILMPGLINLDFADVRTTMLDGGAAIMGSAVAEGPDRAEIAAREAISSPLLDGVSIRGARNVLVNISASSSLKITETTKATSIIQQEAGDDAEIIMGTVLDEDQEDTLRITVIATGFEISSHSSGTKVTSNKKTSASSNNNQGTQTQKPAIPKMENLTGRRPRQFGNQSYKGEPNLKKLDTPAYQRRNLQFPKQQEQQQQEEEQEQEKQSRFGLNRRTGTDNGGGGNNEELLNGRRERINKDDSDQPAFLRKIMD